MAWTDTGRKAQAENTAVASLQITAPSTVDGGFIALAISAYDVPNFSLTGFSVSDPTNGTYTQAFQSITTYQGCALYFFPANAGSGDRVITVIPSPASTYDIWLAVHEFAGGHAVPASGTPSTGTSTSTTASSGSMTPADNDVLLLAACEVDAYTTITQNNATEGFTLSNENENGPGQPGSFVFKILSGAPSTPSHTWGLGASALWNAGIAAFKPAAVSDPSTVPQRMAAIAELAGSGGMIGSIWR